MPRLERTLRVRGYELGPSGAVPIAAFARYFEHLRWESSADPAMNLAQLFTNGHRMVVRTQQIELGRPASVGQAMRLSLWVNRIGRASMDLWHEARVDDSETFVARGIVTAVYLGQDHRPHAIPEQVRNMVDTGGAPSLVSPLGARAPSGAWSRELHVRPSDLDMFNHVNHSVYASYFDDARLAAAKDDAFGELSQAAIRGARAVHIDYRREVLVGHRIEIAAWALDEPQQLGFELRKLGDGELLSSARVVLAEG